MEKSGAKAYLVNTGWNGTGKRISIKDTRGIIDAILSGAILTAPTKKIPYFNFEVPTELPGVDPAILDPRDTYADASAVGRKSKRSGCKIQSRTLQNTRATKLVRLWLLQVLSCNQHLQHIDLHIDLLKRRCSFASPFLSYRKLRFHTIKTLCEDRTAAECVECRLRDPPQAENPVEQDSFSSLFLSGTDFAFIDFSCNFFQFIL